MAIRPAAAVALACGALLASSAIRGADEATPPNVVMIVSDDQAWTDYGFMGHPSIETPHLDRLARQSLAFTRGYVPDSLCRPSLASIVSGLYPHQHGIVGNDPPPPPSLVDVAERRSAYSRTPEYRQVREDYLRLHIDRIPTLPRLLRERGYVSFQSGKWWEGAPSRGGFDSGMTHGDATRGGRHGDEGLKIGRETMQPILEFLDASVESEKPFFLWYAPMLPHTPHDPPEELLAKYATRAPHLPVAKYWAMCERFDATIGELLGALDERGLAENTLVVYVTDNGWINDESASRYAPKSKRSPYDGGLRTPILLRWPGKIEPRRDEDHPISSIDLAPTILRAAGLAPTGDMQGIDLLDAGAVASRDAVFGEIFEHDIRAMDDPDASLRYRWIVAGTWKLIVPNETRLPDAPVELYDLAADPREEKNLAAENPERVAQMRKRLDAWRTR